MKSKVSHWKMEVPRWTRVKEDTCTRRPRRTLRAQEPMPESLLRSKSLREKGLEFKALRRALESDPTESGPSAFP